MKTYAIVVEKTESGYSSYCPEIPGVIATGKTKSEVEDNMQQAVSFHLEALNDDRLESQETYSKVILA